MVRDRYLQARARPSTSWGWLGVLVTLLIAGGWYVVYIGRGIALEYDDIDARGERAARSSVVKIDLPDTDKPLYITDSAALSLNGIWAYVSPTTPLPSPYRPTELTNVTVARSASAAPMTLRPVVNQRLGELFAHASRDGYSLMVASAYRSVKDQQALYDDFVTKRGEAAARQYVAQPGTSEHHTGLAVDVDDASTGCAANSDKCELSYTSIAWLAEHAPEHGFIIRFPSTKQPITGIAAEPWHLRYVGIVLAQQLTDSGLVFDEFIEQIAPGRRKTTTP